MNLKSDLRTKAENLRKTDPVQSIETYKDAVLEARWHLAHTVRHLGDLYAEQNNTAQALQCYDEAIHIYETFPNARDLDYANAIRSKAVITNDRELWVKARALYEAHGIAEGIRECDQHLLG